MGIILNNSKITSWSISLDLPLPPRPNGRKPTLPATRSPALTPLRLPSPVTSAPPGLPTPSRRSPPLSSPTPMVTRSLSSLEERTELPRPRTKPKVDASSMPLATTSASYAATATTTPLNGMKATWIKLADYKIGALVAGTEITAAKWGITYTPTCNVVTSPVTAACATFGSVDDTNYTYGAWWW